MRSGEEKQFLREMRKCHLDERGAGTVISKTLREMFGEEAAIAAISFTGDGEDGLEEFVRLTRELYGEGARSIFENIINNVQQGGAALSGGTEAIGPR